MKKWTLTHIIQRNDGIIQQFFAQSSEKQHLTQKSTKLCTELCTGSKKDYFLTIKPNKHERS